MVLEPEKDKIYKFQQALKKKEETISQLIQQRQEKLTEIQSLNDKVRQYEIDLAYCVEQNNLAFGEIEELKMLLIEKTNEIKRLENDKNNSFALNVGKSNYKFYSELELFVNFI